MKPATAVLFGFLCWLITSASGASVPASRTITNLFIDFERYRFGVVPNDFDYTASGPHGPVLSAGRPLWRTYVDLLAPSPKLVLIQASALSEPDHYPIALLPRSALRTCDCGSVSNSSPAA